MGRITIFTATNDLNSRLVMMDLDKLSIPYTEIDVLKYPSKLIDLHMLTGGDVSLPQAFFNTRYIGGVGAVRAELKRWVKDTKNYKTPYDKFCAEIGSVPAPLDPKFAPPEIPESHSETSSSKGASVTPLEIPKLPATVPLHDGTLTTVLDITEKLKNTLPLEELKCKKGVYHKLSFTGQTAISTFQDAMKLTEEEAKDFCKTLVAQKVIGPIASEATTRGNKSSSASAEIFRLQCHMTPNVLNSYRVWPDNLKENAGSGNTVIARLDDLLTVMETDAFTEDDGGKTDFTKIRTHRHFAAFEEALCELQIVDMTNFLGQSSDSAMIAFCLNVYRVMLRYALIKTGMTETEASRLHMLSNVQFNVGGNLYSFQDWLDGILRGNNPASYSGSKVCFSKTDERRKFALKSKSSPDYRIHFALNLGPSLGGTCSLPFLRFTAANLDHELNVAAHVFCDDDTRVKISSKSGEVQLSTIFAWYKSDFAKSELEILKIVSNFLGTVKLFEMNRLPTVNGNLKSAKVSYLDTDWSRNACNFILYEKESVKAQVNGMKAFMRRFIPPKKAVNEELRMATLKSFNLLDTLSEERFDRITNMCQSEFKVPIVFVSLVDANRQWFKSSQWVCTGSAPSETGRDVSFCGHAIHNASDEIFLVPNAVLDDRFADNPLVTGGPCIRFYAGCPLTVPAGSGGSVNIGTLCLIDQKPRDFSEHQLDRLRYFANEVKREILRRDSMSNSADSQ